MRGLRRGRNRGHRPLKAKGPYPWEYPAGRLEAVTAPTSIRALRRRIPDVYAGFVQLHDAALADGALDARTKELMALAISVAEKCEPCIETHARAAVRRGATEQEAAEAIGVALLMRGGPASQWGPRAFAVVTAALEEQNGQPQLQHQPG